MTSGILIEGISKEEFLSRFVKLEKEIADLKSQVENNTRKEYTLAELAKMTGYGKAHLRRIIQKKAIPFSYEGKELIIAREYAGQIKPKKAA